MTSGEGGSNMKTSCQGGSTKKTSGQEEYHEDKWSGREDHEDKWPGGVTLITGDGLSSSHLAVQGTKRDRQF